MMTLGQFQDMASEGLVVRCTTVQERRDTLELFSEAGFKIDDMTRRHLQIAAEEDRDTTYMHPGTDSKGQGITCYKYFEYAQGTVTHAISYDKIQSLIKTPSFLDDRSADEFERDFAALLHMEGNPY